MTQPGRRLQHLLQAAKHEGVIEVSCGPCNMQKNTERKKQWNMQNIHNIIYHNIYHNITWNSHIEFGAIIIQYKNDLEDVF